MPETTPLIKAALNLRVGAGFDVYDKTVIAIAHRLNSIAGFDRIILFKEGRIVGQGTFEELLHTDSYFMDLYNANVK